jgi:DNA-binding transcriptional MocR family regulator
VWVQLPGGLDAEAMLPLATSHGVLYVAGSAFYVDGRTSDCLRLSFAAPPPERINEGVRRLAAAIAEARVAA